MLGYREWVQTTPPGLLLLLRRVTQALRRNLSGLFGFLDTVIAPAAGFAMRWRHWSLAMARSPSTCCCTHARAGQAEIPQRSTRRNSRPDTAPRPGASTLIVSHS